MKGVNNRTLFIYFLILDILYAYKHQYNVVYINIYFGLTENETSLPIYFSCITDRNS